MNTIEIGMYIKRKRIELHLTQKDLAEKLQISFQAVSKWETGTTLPDTSLLLNLSDILEVTADQILNAGEFRKSMNKKINVQEVENAFKSIPKIKEVLGANNHFYTGMMSGLKEFIKGDFAEVINNKASLEVLVAKSVIQLVIDGYYISEEDIEKYFPTDKIREAVSKYSIKYNS